MFNFCDTQFDPKYIFAVCRWKLILFGDEATAVCYFFLKTILTKMEMAVLKQMFEKS
jgi:hypothetical protein